MRGLNQDVHSFNSLKGGTEIDKIKFEMIGCRDGCWERAGIAVPTEKVQWPVHVKQEWAVDPG